MNTYTTIRLRFWIHYANQREAPPKLCSYGNILPSLIFKFELVPFAFSLILGDPFIASPPKVWGGDGRRELMGSFLGRGVSQNAFSSNLNTVNLNIFLNIIDTLLKKLTTEIGFNLKNILCTQCLWGWRFHVKSVFFFNIFSGELHFDVLKLDVVGQWYISPL